MTQEDKAKVFDEALERARKMLNMILDNKLLGFPDQIREIFPQLKESNDEKIRKDIIDHFESIKAQALYDNQEESDSIVSSCNEKIAYLKKLKEYAVDNSKTSTSDDEKIRQAIIKSIEEDSSVYEQEVSKEQMLAYLEKQKEKKSIEWNKKDEKIIKTIIDVLERSSQVTIYEQRGGLMSASVGYSDKYEEEIAWLKDISLNHKKFIEAVDKLWSNDWSEEDKRMLSRCIKSVECSKQFADSETYKAAKDAEMNWLEFLPKRKNLPPKQEWSEEDEKDIAHIIEILDDCYASGRHDLSKTNHENLVNKLKSLPMRCPKSSDNWKPSEEQIEALDKALYYVPEEIGIPIAKMYRHFNKMKKKLM